MLETNLGDSKILAIKEWEPLKADSFMLESLKSKHNYFCVSTQTCSTLFWDYDSICRLWGEPCSPEHSFGKEQIMFKLKPQGHISSLGL